MKWACAYWIFKVLLVAGGNNGHMHLSSTEVLTMESPSWSLATPLPRALAGVRGVTVGGRLYMTGGVDGGSFWHRGEVTVWLDEEEDWEEAGMMKDARTYHAASSIKMDDEAMEYCH